MSRKTSFAPQVDVVTSNRYLLLHNVVQCDALHVAFKKSNVFPDDMIQDIKNCQTTMKKNDKMLELLQMRGINHNNAFIDALQISGHNLIADTLRDEVIVGSQNKVTWADLDQKLNGFDKSITKQYKEKIVEMINTKITENVAREIWRKKDADKEKMVETKQLQLEDNWNFAEKLKEKDSQIVKLKGGIDTANAEVHSNELNSKHYHDMVDQLKKTHKEDMNRQIKYNTANENSLQRLTERYNDSRCTLAHLTDTLKERVNHHRSLTGQTGGVVSSMGGGAFGGTAEPTCTPRISDEDEHNQGVGVRNSGLEGGISTRHEHRTLADTLALIERLHRGGMLQDSVLEERRAIAELLTSKFEDNLAENLQFYIRNTNSKVDNLEECISQFRDQLKDEENGYRSSDSVITELEKNINQQTAKSEELKCVISALEARIAAMTADSMTLAKRCVTGRAAPTSTTNPSAVRRPVDVHAFNAGRSLQRTSGRNRHQQQHQHQQQQQQQQQQQRQQRRGYISPNRVNVESPSKCSTTPSPRGSPVISDRKRVRPPQQTAPSVHLPSGYTVFPVIQAGAGHRQRNGAVDAAVSRSTPGGSMLSLGNSNGSRISTRWGHGLHR